MAKKTTKPNFQPLEPKQRVVRRREFPFTPYHEDPGMAMQRPTNYLPRSRLPAGTLAPLDTQQFATYPQEQPQDGELLRAFSRTRTMPMQVPSGLSDPPDPVPDIIGGKPQRMPIAAGPRQLPQTTYPMQRRQYVEDSEPKDPVPLVMSYDQARSRGYIDGGRPIEYVKPLTEPRQPAPMQARSIMGPTPMTGPSEWNKYTGEQPRFPVAPSAANAIGPLTQPTGPDQWNVGLRDPQTLLDRLRQRGGLQPATLGGPAPMSPESVAGAQAAVANSPARQERLAMAARAPATRFVDGQGYTPLGRPAYGSGARNLQKSQVGAGRQSNGMTGGGAIGSALMMSGAAVPGMAMGGVPQQPRQPAVDPYATAQATKVRMMQSGQRAPTVMRTQDGNTRVIGSGGVMLKPNEEQLANRSAFAAALDARRGNVASRQMAKGQARDERLQFSKDRQQYGQQGALVQAFQRQGVDPMRAMAMVAAMGGDKTAVNYLSEDNRQTRAAGEFSGRTELEKERNAIERDRLTAEIEQGKNAIDPGVVALQQAGQAAYQQAIADGQTEQEAESAAMQASMGKWQRFGTQPMVQPGQAPPGDTPISRLGDQYEAATGLPQWTGPAYGWMPLVPQGLSKVFGSEKRKRDAAKRISQYGKQ